MTLNSSLSQPAEMHPDGTITLFLPGKPHADGHEQIMEIIVRPLPSGLANYIGWRYSQEAAPIYNLLAHAHGLSEEDRASYTSPAECVNAALGLLPLQDLPEPILGRSLALAGVLDIHGFDEKGEFRDFATDAGRFYFNWFFATLPKLRAEAVAEVIEEWAYEDQDEWLTISGEMVAAHLPQTSQIDIIQVSGAMAIKTKLEAAAVQILSDHVWTDPTLSNPPAQNSASADNVSPETPKRPPNILSLARSAFKKNKAHR